MHTEHQQRRKASHFRSSNEEFIIFFLLNLYLGHVKMTRAHRDDEENDA